jgi:diguanylate cyclase (GGDEF)-like protein
MGSFRLEIRRGIYGLQGRTTLFLTIIVFAATGLTGMTYMRLSRDMMVSQVKRRATDLAEALAAAGSGAVERRDRQRLTAVTEELVRNVDVSYVVFTDVTGHLLAAHQNGPGLLDELIYRTTSQIFVEPINQPELVTRGNRGQHVDIVYPVTVPVVLPNDTPGISTIGFVRLGVSIEGASKQMASIRRNTILLATGIALLMVPLGYQVVRNLLHPVHHLVEAAQAIAAGRLDTRITELRRDELGELCAAFNSMAERMQASHDSLLKQSEELEDRVAERTDALEKANRQLQEAAARDSLTGLYNRRHFNDVLGQLFAESTRYRTDLTCMMIDLDNFKHVNDSLGHQTGDRLLQLVAEIIRRSVRESDVAVRYGGDEFAVILPRTAPDEARTSAERLLDSFRREVVAQLPEASIASLSIGVASRHQDHPSSSADLINLADEALYLAKAGGKNRITVLRPSETSSIRG